MEYQVIAVYRAELIVLGISDSGQGRHQPVVNRPRTACAKRLLDVIPSAGRQDRGQVKAGEQCRVSEQGDALKVRSRSG